MVSQLVHFKSLLFIIGNQGGNNRREDRGGNQGGCGQNSGGQRGGGGGRSNSDKGGGHRGRGSSGGNNGPITWIPNTGATNHVTPDIAALSTSEEYTGNDTLRVGDGKTLSISCICPRAESVLHPTAVSPPLGPVAVPPSLADSDSDSPPPPPTDVAGQSASSDRELPVEAVHLVKRPRRHPIGKTIKSTVRTHEMHTRSRS
ncbi:PREDICTED: uncharacterized protein LOC109177257 [Ipomoea nil]|uniref:uncharacterized protein LOC109177257 n=1 Tax=Ipomoea nil TaxID=35883 RepID=UPI000901100E|nr:PREDICTED: uncharacterized protein LOC109177257 [Ipomoea nil]